MNGFVKGVIIFLGIVMTLFTFGIVGTRNEEERKKYVICFSMLILCVIFIFSRINL